MNLQAARVPIVCLLVLGSTLALGALVAPSYAEINAQSRTHTHTNGPSSSESTSTTILGLLVTAGLVGTALAIKKRLRME